MFVLKNRICALCGAALHRARLCWLPAVLLSVPWHVLFNAVLCAARQGGQITHDLTFENQSGAPVANFAVQFNKNSFGFAPAAPLQVPCPYGPRRLTDWLREQPNLHVTYSIVECRAVPCRAVRHYRPRRWRWQRPCAACGYANRYSECILGAARK